MRSENIPQHKAPEGQGAEGRKALYLARSGLQPLLSFDSPFKFEKHGTEQLLGQT